MNKILVTGVNGQLGYDVVKQLNELNVENLGVDINDFDITNQFVTQKYIKEYNPEVIIHCAAYTAVDRAEDDKEKCYAVNVIGTENIAKACEEINAKMVYVSTDYVFSGQGLEPHEEKETTNPINYYGKTKELGEQAVRKIVRKHFIIRTSWVYGINGNNFVKTMLRLSRTKEEINVINDQVGGPTYTPDLATLIIEMIQTEKYGTYHGVNEGYCSWYEFAYEIFIKSNVNIKVNAISTLEYPTRAKRPLNSRLSKVELDNNGFTRLPQWQDALKRYIKELKEVE